MPSVVIFFDPVGVATGVSEPHATVNTAHAATEERKKELNRI
jgi:hypothetical protein